MESIEQETTQRQAMSSVVLPGDNLTQHITTVSSKDKNHKVKLGAGSHHFFFAPFVFAFFSAADELGIIHIGDDAVACRAGPVETFKQRKYWIDTAMHYVGRPPFLTDNCHC